MPSMTSKARVQAAMRHAPVDHLPLTLEGLCHGWAKPVHDRYHDPFARADYYRQLGVDCGIMYEYPYDIIAETIPVREWQERERGAVYLHKEYATPAGTLRQVVLDTDDYTPLVSPDHAALRDGAGIPAGKHVPLFCDHHVPASRSRQYLIEHAGQLDALEHLLLPLAPRAVDGITRLLREAKAFCDDRQIVLSMYAWGVGDPLMWLSGVERVLTMAIEEARHAAAIHRHRFALAPPHAGGRHRGRR